MSSDDEPTACEMPRRPTRIGSFSPLETQFVSGATIPPFDGKQITSLSCIPFAHYNVDITNPEIRNMIQVLEIYHSYQVEWIQPEITWLTSTLNKLSHKSETYSSLFQRFLMGYFLGHVAAQLYNYLWKLII